MIKHPRNYLELQGLFALLKRNGYNNNNKWYKSLDTLDIDTYLNYHIGHRELLMPLQNCPSETEITFIIAPILDSYNFKLNGLFETMLHDSEVSPVDNVNESRVEHTLVRNEYGDIQTDTKYGSVDTTNIYGDRLTTNVIASRTNSDTIGSQSNSGSNSTQYGQDKSTESIGSGIDTTTQSNSTTAFDTEDYAKGTDKSVNSIQIGAKSNSTTRDQHTDTSTMSETMGSRSDSHTLGGGTDTSTLTGYTDTTGTVRGNDQVTVGHEDDETETDYTVNRHGNIGVTMTGQLIEDYRLYHDFNFYQAIQEIIEHEFIKSFVYDY